jgi:long-chain acyl-CoA synthetase
MPFVVESIVMEKNNKIVALVYPDYEQADSMGMSNDDLQLLMDHNCKEVNKLLAPYENISRISLYPTEFEKTPKKSIKRYLYTI